MSNTKHTPGPWEAHKEPHGLFVSAESFCIARLGDGLSKGQRENAHLIAAAPELLAALESIASWTETREMSPQQIARAAIAKAKGE